MSHGTVNYGTESISFNVLHGSRKTLAIEVYPDSSVVVKAPTGTGLDEIQKIVIKRARWIIRQQRYFRQFDPRTPQRQFVGGETHLYLGKQFRLKISEGASDSVKLSRGYFLVVAKDVICPEKIRTLLNRWYADRSAEIFHKRFERCWLRFEKLVSERPRLQIKRMNTRWGSLSRGGILTLNTDLIRAPGECVDYVITHELCHLQFHDHGSEFYRLLEKVMPDWEKRKHKLELVLA